MNNSLKSRFDKADDISKEDVPATSLISNNKLIEECYFEWKTSDVLINHFSTFGSLIMHLKTLWATPFNIKTNIDTKLPLSPEQSNSIEKLVKNFESVTDRIWPNSSFSLRLLKEKNELMTILSWRLENSNENELEFKEFLKPNTSGQKRNFSYSKYTKDSQYFFRIKIENFFDDEQEIADTAQVQLKGINI